MLIKIEISLPTSSGKKYKTAMKKRKIITNGLTRIQ
jgi:hypothetical protein